MKQTLRRLEQLETRIQETNDAIGELLGTLPPEYSRWSFLAQDQYLEIADHWVALLEESVPLAPPADG